MAIHKGTTQITIGIHHSERCAMRFYAAPTQSLRRLLKYPRARQDCSEMYARAI